MAGQQDSNTALGAGDDALCAGWTERTARWPCGVGVKRKVLIIVENAPVPLDPRVWKEALALSNADYGVTVLCPKGKKNEQSYELLQGIHIYRHPMPKE